MFANSLLRLDKGPVNQVPFLLRWLGKLDSGQAST